MADTDFNFPTATTSSASVTTPDNAWTDDSNNATWPDDNAATATYQDFEFDGEIPDGASINGIEVVLKEASNVGSSNAAVVVALSHNGGSNYTSNKDFSTTSDTYVEETEGGATDTWGRSWTPEEFNDANFRLKISGNATDSATSLHVDYVKVKVYYTPRVAGGHSALII